MIPAFLADRENRKRRGELDNENRIGATVHVYGYDIARELDDDDDEDDEVVLETKGSSPPPAPSPMSEAQAQIELERARAQIQQEAEARAAAAAAAEKQARIDKARGLQAQAYGAATNYGDTQVRARGFDQGLVDQYNLLDLYNQAVDMARLGIAEDDLNPMATYNTKTMFNDALSTALGTYRGDLNRQLNTLAPEDFAYNIFSDSSDDSILQAILDSGKTDAQAQIDAARARGQLNDVGYGRAIKQLGQQGEAAWADLQDLGGGVLSGYRDQLDALRSGMADKIGSADFSNPLSFDNWMNRLEQTKSDLTGRMSGDIYRATQGQSFFDPSTIISSSGALQGYYNPTTNTTKQSPGLANPLLSAFTDEEQKKQQQGTSGGINNGVF